MTYMERMRKRYGAGTLMWRYKIWNQVTGYVFMTDLTQESPDDYIKNYGVSSWRVIEMQPVIL